MLTKVARERYSSTPAGLVRTSPHLARSQVGCGGFGGSEGGGGGGGGDGGERGGGDGEQYSTLDQLESAAVKLVTLLSDHSSYACRRVQELSSAEPENIFSSVVTLPVFQSPTC